MQEFTPNTNRAAHSRTFNILSVTRECGVTTDVEYTTVQLTRADTGLTAQINGQPAELERAVATLRTAERVWLLEEVLTEPAPVAAEVAVIGKAVACELHRELGRLGYREHYALAGDVLNRVVPSLAAITAAERDLVREYAYGQLGLMVGGWAA
ncbi:hypothetical protein [Deinococcus alpinitundrae]|uniref:hypothetical protein n=1 Tax=Deinococcus alpinitundrae TaxID=468913 RepID=UPI00137AA1CE|nr:hypothetical protein [Deinococcus alpinitundrae]